MKDLSQFIEWAFQGLISGGIVYGVTVLSDLKKSIDELNIKMAQIIERMSSHEKRLDRHEEKIEKIEEKI